jgi:SAM-dependent methyltransferase
VSAARAPAAQRWADALAGWAIPPTILDQAPESPWIHPVALFHAGDGPIPDSPSHRVARQALPPGGSVLDVGCGGGRAAFALAPPAARTVGVDSQPRMLEAFAAAAGARGLDHAEVLGTWPDVAGRVERCDVVVCHHVAYNVADLVGFAAALTAKARVRVVVELTDRHPLAATAPLWQRFWNLARPDGPDAEAAAAALREAGTPVTIEFWDEPDAARRLRDVPFDDQVRFMRIRLCLPAERDPDVAATLADLGPHRPRRLATMWWDVTS